jgi:hypothetical protein
LKKSNGITTAVSACRSASVMQNWPMPPSTPIPISQAHSSGSGQRQTNSAGTSDRGIIRSAM